LAATPVFTGALYDHPAQGSQHWRKAKAFLKHGIAGGNRAYFGGENPRLG
jgi:hypothetical protein